MSALYVLVPGREHWPSDAWGRTLRSHLVGANRERQAQSSYALVAQLLDYEQPPAPAGVFRALSHDDADESHWLLAEPAHCRADLTDAFVVGLSAQLDLSLEDAKLLASEAQADLPAEAEFRISDSGDWFVCLPRNPEIQTRLPAEVKGQSLGAALPQGKQRQLWTKALNSIQITWHNSEVNQRRLSNNLVAVNGLLLWGEGAWPVKSRREALSVATAPGPVCWLARFSNCRVVDLGPGFAAATWPVPIDILDISGADGETCTALLSDPAGLFRRSGRDNVVWVEPDGFASATTRRAWWRFWGA